jgi:hypothetical protein
MLTIAAVLLTGCASKPVANRVVPLELVTDGPLVVRASAVWDEDWLLDNFGANVILAHALPVRVALENRGDGPLDVRKLRLDVSDLEGRSFRQLSAKSARKLIERTYPLGIRSVEGDKAYREDFAANALDLDHPLPAGASRQGFVFFEMPKGVSREVALEIRVAATRR